MDTQLFYSDAIEQSLGYAQNQFWEVLVEPYMNYKSVVWDYTLIETSEHYQITINLNGLNANTIKVYVRFNKLHVQALFYKSEISWQRRSYIPGTYYRQFPLPSLADEDQVSLKQLDKTLRITIQKRDVDKSYQPKQFAPVVVPQNNQRRLLYQIWYFVKRVGQRFFSRK